MEKIEAIYPLSPVQHGMLFHSLYAPRGGVYVEQLHCVLKGRLNPGAFERAWQRVVDRHPVLRTAFIWEGLEEPLQVVHEHCEMRVEHHDWRGLSLDEQDVHLSRLLGADSRRGFDLADAPLMRLVLIRGLDATHRFVWTHHHILLDGWSVPLVLEEVFALYEAFCRGEDLRLEPRRPYRDYIGELLAQDARGLHRPHPSRRRQARGRDRSVRGELRRAADQALPLLDPGPAEPRPPPPAHLEHARAGSVGRPARPLQR